MEPRRSDDLHYLWRLAPVAASGVLLFILSPILTPFLLAAILPGNLLQGYVLHSEGVIFALPVSAALLVWLRELRRSYMASNVYQGSSARG